MTLKGSGEAGLEAMPAGLDPAKNRSENLPGEKMAHDGWQAFSPSNKFRCESSR
jgi:hypothetical protein